MHEKWGNPKGSLWQKAAKLRMNLTPAERILWGHLKEKQLGEEFIPQRPIGSYIVDFCCSEHNLIIELDGDSHAQDGVPEYDEQRTEYLESLGWRVIRFTNRDVTQNLEAVLNQIHLCLNSPK
ncbi:endonuclease domain-containing protein [bacterium]|nr:endonuclease domain-containing protein [bacterium]MBU1636303.1 endonuclease domain-containing protein [bacterium]